MLGLFRSVTNAYNLCWKNRDSFNLPTWRFPEKTRRRRADVWIFKAVEVIQNRHMHPPERIIVDTLRYLGVGPPTVTVQKWIYSYWTIKKLHQKIPSSSLCIHRAPGTIFNQSPLWQRNLKKHQAIYPGQQPKPKPNQHLPKATTSPKPPPPKDQHHNYQHQHPSTNTHLQP